jgi:hypothetical protein
MELNQLDREVLGMLLAGDDPTLRVLDEQCRVAEVAKREVTGVGFVTTFSVPAGAPGLEGRKKNFSFGDVVAQITGLQHGAGFVLHVRDGIIQSLEGYSYDEPWPATTTQFALSYTGKGGRNLSTLRRKWL